jgi:curli biogenesis system outer membrane secretion channel CsgG
MPTLYKALTACLILLLSCFPAHSIWFEASGQAIVSNGNKDVARQRATQEAIKQALLFAGASVDSVQRMANGLLQDDRLEIRASGEVNSIELIDEIYQDGFITVSVRADIFPQDVKCQASDYRKKIVTTWYPLKYRQQAAVGGMYDFGRVIANKLQREFNQTTQYSQIKRVEPYYHYPELSTEREQALSLARKVNAQFVLFGEITEFAVEQQKSSGLAFWNNSNPSRNFSLNLGLYDGTTGDIVFQQEHSISAEWDFDLHQQVVPNSQALWRSPYGQSVNSLLQEVALQIDQSVSCLTAYGQVLLVSNGQLTVNIGSEDGVREGDHLTLFQLSQFYDSQGQIHQQFNLHPAKVTVSRVFAQTAIVISASEMPLANIQTNDFVARR